jgi:octaprenyl-diphosphate synthase
MGLREAILAPIADKLADLDREFEKNLSSPVPLIAEINQHIARHSGKRIRPTLLLLSARMLGYRGRGDVVFSAVIEFIHTATLIHDDIIDNADIRRGEKSVNAIWGNNVTVLLGDYLYLKSMEMALTEKSLRGLEILTEVTIAMIEGELIQLSKKGDLKVSREDYLAIIRRKTAALFSGCGRIAALLTAANAEHTYALEQYCLEVGLAFQLVDDVLDFAGDESLLGKPVVNDLREGRVTLPIIELLDRAPEALATVRRVVETGKVDAADQKALLQLLREHGTLDSASALAQDHARRARKHLAAFPDNDAKRVLEMIPDYIISRSS